MTTISARQFGTVSGKTVDLFTLRNSNGFAVSITNYGGRITSILAPDRHGKTEDVVLGFDALDGYVAKNPYFGALVGRYANRIANARFTLDGKTYQLEANNGTNSLHGGMHGFDKVAWDVKVQTGENGDALVLIYKSVDGECGYPGNLTTQVTYALTDTNELHILFKASTDKKTVLNLTNHSYFDLSGKQGQNGILGHVVTIRADRFVPANENQIPTGELAPVAGTPFDFTTAHAIGERIEAKHDQIKLGIGYDHTFVVNGDAGQLRSAATVVDPGSGRVLEVLTTEPGVQFYSGNHLDGSVKGKGGVAYGFRTGFCLETQHFPDSPNQPQFPSTILNPGEEFQSTTIFRFSVQN